MNNIKVYLKSFFFFGIVGLSIIITHGALQNVQPGDNLTANAWNEIIEKLSNINTNNDDLVTKSYVDSQMSSNNSQATFVGFTSTTYNGNMGGIKGFNDKCNAQYPGSRGCLYDEIIIPNSGFDWSETAWLIDGSYSNYKYQITKDSYYSVDNSYDQYPLCKGWTTNNALYRGSSSTTSGNLTLSGCSNLNKISCCKN